MKKNTKIPIIFRKTPFNHFTLPVLFNLLERPKWEKHFKPIIADSFSSMRNKIPANGHSLIAYSFMTPQLPEIEKEISQLRKIIHKNTVVIAGGPHPSGDPVNTIKIGFDGVSAGEGESTFPQICETFLTDFRDIKGKIFRSKYRNALNRSFPISNAISMISPLELTRGCLNRCTFCQTGRIHPVHRSLESVQYYLDELVKRKYLHRVGFITPSGFEYGSVKKDQLHPEKLEAVLRLATERKITFCEYGIFPSEVRPDTVRPVFLKLISKFCTNKHITIGAQSGSDTLLHRLRRNHNTAQIERATALTREHGLTPNLDFILGLPGETEDDQEKTLAIVKHLCTKYRARVQMHFFISLSGTSLENQEPVFPGDRIIQKLRQFNKNGICTNWWEEGLVLSKNITQKLRRLHKIV